MNIDLSAKTQAEIIEHHRSTGWTIIRSKIAPVIFARRSSVRTENGVWVKAWTGNARVPSWNYTFRNDAMAESCAAELVEQVRARIARKAAQTAERQAKRATLKASDHWSVGDVVYTSWGYDQTNVEYYQITEVKARSVVVRQVCVNSSDHGQPGGGKVAPRRFEFCSPAFLCPVSEDGRFTAGPCYGKDKPSFRHNCYKWDGRAHYTSSDR